MENKREIVKALFECLKLTRAGEEIVDMEYVKEVSAIVIITYSNGYQIEVNVSLDSGCALIRDVMRKIK